MSKTRLLPGSGAVFSGMPPLSCILQEKGEKRGNGNTAVEMKKKGGKNLKKPQ